MSYPEFSQQSVIVKRSDLSYFSFSENVILNVPAGGTYSYAIYAPANSICNTQILRAVVPYKAGASSGTHRISFVVASQTLCIGESLFGDNISFSYGYFYSATGAFNYPSDKLIQTMITKDVLFTDTVGFTIKYDNLTDVLQDSELQIRLLARKQVI